MTYILQRIVQDKNGLEHICSSNSICNACMITLLLLVITSLCCIGRSSHTVNQQQGWRSSREACSPLFPCSFEEAFVCLFSPPVIDVGLMISLPSTILL